MSVAKVLFVSLGAGAVAIATVIVGGLPAPARTRSASVMVIRDLDELRFTNDSDIDLHRCRIAIDGAFSADLKGLPARGRGSIPRSAFAVDLPRDEFYRRARTMAIACFDDNDVRVVVELK